MEFEKENDALFKDVHDNYAVFRGKVEEYVKSTEQCKKAIKKFEEQIEALEESSEKLSPETEKLVEQRKNEIEKMCNYLPKQNHILLMLFVGDFNVVLPRNEDKIKYKKQYEMFKLWYILGQLLFSSINMFFGPSRIIEGFLQFYLVWFYCNLTLKESILTHNGSRIRTWWLAQHYLDIILYGFLLIRYFIGCQLNTTSHVFLIPECSRNDGDFSLQFSLYIFYMSGCQVLQFYYQQGSLYKLRALGRAESMEVSAEGLRVKTFADLQFLFPFFLVLYCYQFYNSYVLWHLAEIARADERWEVLLCSCLFFVIALGNIVTLLQVVYVKYQQRRTRIASSSRSSLKSE